MRYSRKYSLFKVNHSQKWINVKEALKTSGRNNLQKPGVVSWRAARKLFIYRVQQLCLVIGNIASVRLHVSSRVWLCVKNLVLFLGLTGDMQSLAGSGEIWGKREIYFTDLSAACVGACQGRVLPCPHLLYILLTGPLPCARSCTNSLVLQECWRPAGTIIPRAS